ncbi:MAG: hypothetical protein IPK13_16290 [Deltaproteobacteria bacterium]|nr:hypothetical protein [Deltaproteobacteria bacterium]
MKDVNLLVVCANAFAATIGLLSGLALILRGLVELFPEKPKEAKDSTDAAMVAAITSAVATVIPGARVTLIEEKKVAS